MPAEAQFQVNLDKVVQRLLERNGALTNEVVHLQVLVEQLVEQQELLKQQLERASAEPDGD